MKLFKKKINNLAKEIQKDFNLTRWNSSIIFELKKTHNSACIYIQNSYLSYQIEINKPVLELWENKDYSGVVNVLIHEHIHLLFHPLHLLTETKQLGYLCSDSHKELASTVLEQGVQSVTSLFTPFYNDKYKKIIKHN